jgi:hypothetical protein
MNVVILRICRFLGRAVKNQDNEDMPMFLEFSNPSTIPGKNKGRPRNKGRARAQKKLKGRQS